MLPRHVVCRCLLRCHARRHAAARRALDEAPLLLLRFDAADMLLMSYAADSASQRCRHARRLYVATYAADYAAYD